MSDSKYLLEIAQIVKDYPGVRAVDHANLNLYHGEIHALVGENGAGKSTLVKIMAGVIQPDEGYLKFEGNLINLKSGKEAYKIGFSFIHQELNLISYMNAAENVFLGHQYPKTSLGLIKWKELEAKTENIFDNLGVDIKVNIPVGRLSPGEQSMVAIARAFALDAKLYVMDEPTASLSENEIESLFNVIKTLKTQGKTILYITHRLEEVFILTDRVTVMRDGKTVDTIKTQNIDKDSLISLMIGKDLNQYYPPPENIISHPILEVKKVKNNNIKNISFTLHAGEVLGISGLIGSGRSELLNMLFGLDPIDEGEIILFGKKYFAKHPSNSIKNKIALVPEERRSQGLIMSHTVSENVVLPHLNYLALINIFTDRNKEKDISEKVVSEVNLKTTSVTNSVSTLSGGNQQKVVFARWMIRDFDILLLDEPTRGVDVGARFEIYKTIRHMASKGAGIIMVSSDFQEILGLSDRILVMREGHIVKELINKNLTKYDILKHAYKAV